MANDGPEGGRDRWVPIGTEDDVWQPEGVQRRAEREGYAFRIEPQNNNQLLTENELLIDGYRSGGWRAKTLFLRTRLQGGRVGGAPEIDPQTNLPVPLAVRGSTMFQIDGLLEGAGTYIRRFMLAPDRLIALNIAAFKDIRVRILESSVPGYGAVAVLTVREPTTIGTQEPVYLSQRYSPAARYRTPPGAISLAPAIADPGFRWEGRDPLATATILDPQLVGIRSRTKAPVFITSIPTFTATWEVLL